MPDFLDDNEIEDTASSTDPNLDAKAKDKDPAPVDATSSTATGDEDADLLSVVRDVVDDSRKAETASPAESEEVDGQSTDDQPQDDKDDAYTDVPFHKHPRFQQLLRQRDSYRGERDEFKVDAERYRNVQTFIDQNGLSADEVADGLMTMALMKNNPIEAWKRMRPTVQNLLIAAGEVLPEDLNQMVANGEMSQEAALEVSRSRAAAKSMQAFQSFSEQRQERERQTSIATSLKSAANDWEVDRRKKDPNFDAKLEPLQKEVLFLQMTEGKPNTPDGVRAQLKKAYDRVNASLRPQRANPAPARNTRPVTGGQVAGGQMPDREKMSTLDIIRANRHSA